MQPVFSWSQHPACRCCGQVKGGQEAKRGIGGWLAEGHSGPGRGWRTGQSRAAGTGAEVSHKGKVPGEAASQTAIRRGKANRRLCARPIAPGTCQPSDSPLLVREDGHSPHLLRVGHRASSLTPRPPESEEPVKST